MVPLAFSTLHLMKAESSDAHSWLVEERKSMLAPMYRNTAAFSTRSLDTSTHERKCNAHKRA